MADIKNIRDRISSEIFRLLVPKNYDISNTIVITGTPRSGTTWLAELISTIPNSSIIFEPLHLSRVREARIAGFEWRTIFQPGEERVKEKEYLERVFHGSILNGWTIRDMKFIRMIGLKHWIVKFVRANLIIEWLIENFSIKKPILIIRHPCAVISSQLRYGSWNNINGPLFANKRIVELFPQFKEYSRGLTTLEECLASRWCIENYIPLTLKKPYPFILVAYERLVLNSHEEIKRIFNELNMDVPDKIYKYIGKPSITTLEDSAIKYNSDILSHWKTNLTVQQQDSIFKVLKRYNIEFYNEHIEPDYGILYSDNPINIT